jgi:hypothetical protein
MPVSSRKYRGNAVNACPPSLPRCTRPLRSVRRHFLCRRAFWLGYKPTPDFEALCTPGSCPSRSSPPWLCRRLSRTSSSERSHRAGRPLQRLQASSYPSCTLQTLRPSNNGCVGNRPIEELFTPAMEVERRALLEALWRWSSTPPACVGGGHDAGRFLRPCWALCGLATGGEPPTVPEGNGGR